MRPSFCQRCLAFLLKFLNYLQTFVGVSLILYSVWMLNRWHRHGHGGSGFSFDFDKLPAPWLVCSLMGIGIFVCLIAFTGHIAAETINGCCLCFYAVLTTILILLEAALVSDLVFNKHWEEDLPHDATGQLKSLRAFIEANIGICKWVAVTVLVVQALSLLLAVILRGMASPRSVDYDSDEEFFTVRKPLLNPQGGPTFASTSFDNTVVSSDTWNSRIKQKVRWSWDDLPVLIINACLWHLHAL
ncbi:tetraspanin-20 isoform X2 [Elaeis guineensis]|uniref:tetraspanin-20 isoform X2 n=1 Tax=Elaeis guineensis var. tenera TaxID=51953 RepID=UPI003C6D86B8